MCSICSSLAEAVPSSHDQIRRDDGNVGMEETAHKDVQYQDTQDAQNNLLQIFMRRLKISVFLPMSEHHMKKLALPKSHTTTICTCASHTVTLLSRIIYLKPAGLALIFRFLLLA